VGVKFSFTLKDEVLGGEELYLLAFNAVYSVESQAMFRKNMLLPSSGQKNKLSTRPA
jgi:hypothetical protein